jgi:hypothetical protein
MPWLKRFLSREKVKLSPHEASKVAKQVAFLLNNKDKLSPALVKSTAKILDKSYQEKTGKKIVGRRKFPESSTPSMDSKNTSTASKDSDRQQQELDRADPQHGFRGSACYAASSKFTGPMKADGTPDMSYKATRCEMVCSDASTSKCVSTAGMAATTTASAALNATP